jgi:hypothetical protein
MLLYAATHTPRLSYIAAFIGHELFQRAIEITTDPGVFKSYAGPRINYHELPADEQAFHLVNVSLLFEQGLANQALQCFDANGYKAFFKTQGGGFSFDIFAASFYLLSRYEEYLPHEKDHYGRYSHTNSLAFKESFLHLPLVNIWLADFKSALLAKYPGIRFNQRPFAYIPTYDIDIAYAYLGKGWIRNAGGFLTDLFKLNLARLTERTRVLFTGRNDPFDCYAWLDALHKSCRSRALYFFLVAGKPTRFDKNISPDAGSLRQLIKSHASAYETGIHPSWASGDNEGVLENEKEMLEKLTGKEIVNSRQHYLRFTLPQTYRLLLHAGILKEFSMGYGTINGFRASVASSFYWYDLQREASTSLRIYPFCFMDATSFYQQKLAPAQALEELRQYRTAIQDVGGLMITIWHNQLLGTDPMFTGWREVYEQFVKVGRHLS